MNNKMICNVNLPSDALNVSNVRPGMVIRTAYDRHAPSEVVRVTRVYGDRIIIETVDRNIEATAAGTVRLVRDGYDYHAGHGCAAEGRTA